MNTTLALALLRQRLTSPMRGLLVACAFVPPAIAAMFMLTPAPVQSIPYFFGLVLAAGAIGQDVSSGVLQLTFARPVPRPVYVTSRWLGAGAGAAALGLAQLVFTCALLAMRGAMPGALDVLAMALSGVVAAFTAAAVMIGLSSLVGGLGDVALFALGMFGAQVGKSIALFRGWTTVAMACGELQRTLQPGIDFGFIAGHGSPAWTDLVTAASTIALALSVAIVAVNRKELSYAAD